jgi:hypothetical protein
MDFLGLEAPSQSFTKHVVSAVSGRSSARHGVSLNDDEKHWTTCSVRDPQRVFSSCVRCAFIIHKRRKTFSRCFPLDDKGKHTNMIDHMLCRCLLKPC